MSDLKSVLSNGLPQRDAVLVILGTFDAPVAVKNIKLRAAENGLRAASAWNISELLKRSRGKAILLPSGWELTAHGRQHLKSLGVTDGSSFARVQASLRAKMVAIKNDDTRAFVEEAISCVEHKLWRSAIVMSWLAAIHILQHYVISECLDEFNVEARRIDPSWKPAKKADDLSRMKEKDFLNRLAGISVIGKDVKHELEQCLVRRNSCGHPNSYRISEHGVTHHLETLILNVFEPINLP